MMTTAIWMAACAQGITTAPEGVGNLGKFNKVWQDFDSHYAYFDAGSIDWLSIGSSYRARASATTTDSELASVLGAMIGELRDYHADITTSYGTFGAPPIPYAHHYDPALVARYFARPLRATASGRLHYTTLSDGVGYVLIPSFAGADWGAEIVDALDAMGAIPALIVDIRDNGGGSEDVALAVASHFADSRRVYRSAKFRDGPSHGDFGRVSTFSITPQNPRFTAPVALITNRFNGSAAEEFTLMMRILPTVITVGDTTLGLGSNPLRVTLSNGWSYRIPQSIQATPDGFVYQWRGLPPRIAVRWNDADTQAGHDPYLDSALNELRQIRR